MQRKGRLGSFKAYCARRGYELLADDYRFIDRSLDGFVKVDFKTILERYLEEWSKGMQEAENFSSAQGIGRRRANLWLLEYVEKNKAR